MSKLCGLALPKCQGICSEVPWWALQNSQSWQSLCVLIYQSIGIVYGGLGEGHLCSPSCLKDKKMHLSKWRFLAAVHAI